MANFSADIRTFTRSNGDTIAAKLAYRTAWRVECTRTGTTHDYRRKRGVVYVATFVSNDVIDTPRQPSAIGSASVRRLSKTETLDAWAAAENAERRKNSQIAREAILALPHELNERQHRELGESAALYLTAKHGVIATVAVHSPTADNDARNHHAHVMWSTRRIVNGEGQVTFGKKTRELDEMERSSICIHQFRAFWEHEVNKALQAAGCAERVDRRSLKDRGIDRQPRKHLGPVASAMERRGIRTRAGDYNRAIDAEEFARSATQAAAQAQKAAVEAAAARAHANFDQRRRAISSTRSERERAMQKAVLERRWLLAQATTEKNKARKDRVAARRQEARLRLEAGQKAPFTQEAAAIPVVETAERLPVEAPVPIADEPLNWHSSQSEMDLEASQSVVEPVAIAVPSAKDQAPAAADAEFEPPDKPCSEPSARQISGTSSNSPFQAAWQNLMAQPARPTERKRADVDRTSGHRVGEQRPQPEKNVAPASQVHQVSPTPSNSRISAVSSSEKSRAPLSAATPVAPSEAVAPARVKVATPPIPALSPANTPAVTSSANISHQTPPAPTSSSAQTNWADPVRVNSPPAAHAGATPAPPTPVASDVRAAPTAPEILQLYEAATASMRVVARGLRALALRDPEDTIEPDLAAAKAVAARAKDVNARQLFLLLGVCLRKGRAKGIPSLLIDARMRQVRFPDLAKALSEAGGTRIARFILDETSGRGANRARTQDQGKARGGTGIGG